MANVKVKINGGDSIRFIRGEDVSFQLRMVNADTLAPLPYPWTLTFSVLKEDKTVLDVLGVSDDFVQGLCTVALTALQTASLPIGNDQAAQIKLVYGDGKITFIKAVKLFSVEGVLF